MRQDLKLSPAAVINSTVWHLMRKIFSEPVRKGSQRVRFKQFIEFEKAARKSFMEVFVSRTAYPVNYLEYKKGQQNCDNQKEENPQKSVYHFKYGIVYFHNAF